MLCFYFDLEAPHENTKGQRYLHCVNSNRYFLAMDAIYTKCKYQHFWWYAMYTCYLYYLFYIHTSDQMFEIIKTFYLFSFWKKDEFIWSNK